ncbi:MAG TPA: calcium-binding EGF-like domain-containing protein [Chitinophagaceae bacterium]|nr:calcium-binding EGF-like domain-containing protein [Chitinophagaceae bacterium]
MKKIQLVLYTSSFILLSFFMIVMNACKKKEIKYNDTTLIRPCENVVCLNGGNCVDGQCNCPKGYEGTKCEVKWNQKFSGSFIAVDDCNMANPNYHVVLSPDAGTPYIVNIYNLGIFCPNKIIKAEVNPEKTSFIIHNQNTCGNNWISGYANVNGNFINFYLNTRDSVQHTGNVCSIIISKE